MQSWTEERCNTLIQRLLKLMGVHDPIRRLEWQTCVVGADEEDTELRMVAKVCTDVGNYALRVESDAGHIRLEQIAFQRLLHQSRINVPEVNQVYSGTLEDQGTITASLEEWLEGAPLSGADLVDYAVLLGRLHGCSKRILNPFNIRRDHILYDTERMKLEMESKLSDSPVRVCLIQAITTLMKNTQKQMEKQQCFPVHGDYATGNMIRHGDALFLFDFGRSGNGYLPEEAGEAFAEMASSCFSFFEWGSHLEVFLAAYERYANADPSEIELTRKAAAIAMVIRILLSDQSAIQREKKCSEILEGVHTLL